MSICVTMFAVLPSVQAQGLAEQVSRYEFADALEQAQCRDCLVPLQETKARYTEIRLEGQKKDPQKALDDIVFDQAIREGENYFTCVAEVVDDGIMNGFPRTTSPYCSGRFCGSSFLTVVELIESVVRLIGPKVWEDYAIDRREVARRAKDSSSVTFIQRARVAQALRRCPDSSCVAQNNEEFDLRLRRCSLDITRCSFSPSGSFTDKVAATPKLNVLINAGIISKEHNLGDRFDLVDRQKMNEMLVQAKKMFSCASDTYMDYDADLIDNRDDLCPYVYDSQQRDLDRDGIGDVCDDDIDGDGLKNELGVVDAQGVLIPRLALLSEDNCILLANGEQDNSDSDGLGNSCDPDAIGFVSSFIALQADASPYYGNAPLTVDFTQKNKGLAGLIHWDFADGTSTRANSARHIFAKAGVYFVKATAMKNTNQYISMVPIEVGPDLRIQAGLEVVSKNLIAQVGDKFLIQHVGVGDIQKLTVRSAGVEETIDLKESISIRINEPGVHNIELQAYNSIGQRVALSQFTVDLSKQLGSQLHSSSIDPLVGNVVDLTTIIGGFSEEEVLEVQRDFGDLDRKDGGLVMSHVRTTPGVYLVKQTIQFRDRTRSDHENVLTVVIQPEKLGKKIHLVVDELQKGTGDPFVFTLETENIPLQDIRFCDWIFSPTDRKKIVSPTAKDLEQSYAFRSPGSYPVVVLCQSKTQQRYHVAVTVAVEQGNICLEGTDSLKCDMDKDTIPDMCDDDIDGDGIPNLMNILLKELSDCSINSGNINQDILTATTNACAGGAALDNCSFVNNPDQNDTDSNGVGGACGGDNGGGAMPGGDNGGGATPGGATPGGDNGGGATPGGTGVMITGSTAGGTTVGGTTAGNDTDGDGIENDIDACAGTPESANGNSDADGCPEAPEDESNDLDVPDNPLIEVDSCTQCPCPEADYASSLRKGDRVRALLLDEAGSIIYRYTKPEIIQEDIPDKLLGK